MAQEELKLDLEDIDNKRAQLTITKGRKKYALVIGRVIPAKKEKPAAEEPTDPEKPEEEPAEPTEE